MFCPKCGTQLPDDALLCGACGSNLNRAADGSSRAGSKAVPGQALQPHGQRGLSSREAGAHAASMLPTAICVVCGLLFATCIVVVAQGFAREVQLLVASLSMLDEAIVAAVPLVCAVCLAIPCALCLFGFENCVERIVRRYAQKEKIGRTIFQGIFAAVLLVAFAVAPWFVDLLASMQIDRALLVAIEAGVDSVARVARAGAWIPIVVAVLLIVANGFVPALGNEREALDS